ncbi:energy-coupling factor ABC transporter ATP-binding protein [Salinispira pacifica]|uniref:ATPase component of general energizing module of ECF transporter n=1 Tax=Salinispira pacifica TaxID=1307761 RepID=V5WGW3_9SPIO|nr:ABC transporter ATP-binding protein [Salinispira pacifica]AHC15052.1 ATPase component of general energizing module of ECF transporter [Salinispira pacifica]
MLEADHISLSIDGHQILSNISCSFHKGEITVITGPNGAGKTMLIHALAGLLDDMEGDIRLNSAPYPAKGKALGTGVGLVFQQPEMQVIEQTVEEDILFGLRNLKISEEERQTRLEYALEWSGLHEHRDQNPRSLSGGEIRRLALASILAMNPDYILMDEPFENLDYPGVVETLHQILRLKEENRGIVIVTHGLEKCLALADRLILLKEGRIIADALPERVLNFLEDHDVRKPPMKIKDMTWLKT